MHVPPLPYRTILPLRAPLFLFSHRHYLKTNHSRFAFYLNKYGTLKFPPYRHPHNFALSRAVSLNPQNYWSRHVSKNTTGWVPGSNYITGDWTQKFFVDHHQMYTLRHVTSGVQFRIRRYPICHQFRNPSRYLIGKGMFAWSRGQPGVIDEATLTKNQRAALVKKGYLSA